MDLHSPKESGTYFLHFCTTSEDNNHFFTKDNTFANILILEHLINLENAWYTYKEIFIFLFRVITAS